MNGAKPIRKLNWLEVSPEIDVTKCRTRGVLNPCGQKTTLMTEFMRAEMPI